MTVVVPGGTETMRLCQFQMRMVWSSLAETIRVLLVELHADVVQVADA